MCLFGLGDRKLYLPNQFTGLGMLKLQGVHIRTVNAGGKI